MLMYKIYIVNSIDERVIATVTHCKPITAKPDDVDVFKFIDLRKCCLQYVICLKWKPTDTKQNHNNNQHFYDFHFILQQCNISGI